MENYLQKKTKVWKHIFFLHRNKIVQSTKQTTLGKHNVDAGFSLLLFHCLIYRVGNFYGKIRERLFKFGNLYHHLNGCKWSINLTFSIALTLILFLLLSAANHQYIFSILVQNNNNFSNKPFPNIPNHHFEAFFVWSSVFEKGKNSFFQPDMIINKRKENEQKQL